MLAVESEPMAIPEVDELMLSDSQLDFSVRNALKTAVKDTGYRYEEFVAELKHNIPPSTEEAAALVTCLKALTGAVSCLDMVHHKKLFHDIFEMRLWNYGTDVMDALIDFVKSLASAGVYIDVCLDMLVINFVPPLYRAAYFSELLKHPRGLAKKKEVLDRVHSTLHYIANLVPFAPVRLEKIVRDRMPRPREKPHENAPMMMYVENMLRLEASTMGETLRSSMLIIILDRLVELDVDIPWCDILHDEFQKGIFDMELEDLHGGDNDFNELIERIISEKTYPQSLEALMVLTFDHLKSCHESGRLPQVFEVLLQGFQKTVLTAYKSKFAQFVVFYACSLDPESCGEEFASLLLNIFLNGYNPTWRMSAVAYLSSYLARAIFLPISYIATILESLLAWCMEYRKNQNGQINPRAHKLFYAACQAIMYVLCFRMKELIAARSINSEQLLECLKNILENGLNPLQVCLPSIVEEFLRLAKANGLFSMPQSFIEEGLLESANSQAYGGTERFDMFFPFDPCLLRKCDSFIRPKYIFWSMVRKNYEECDEDYSSEEDDAEDYETENGMSIPDNGSARSHEDANIDEFDYSLDKMSITPKDLSHKFGGRFNGFAQMPSRIRPSTSPESL